MMITRLLSKYQNRGMAVHRQLSSSRPSSRTVRRYQQEKPLVMEEPELPDARLARAQLSVNLTRNQPPDTTEDFIVNAELGKEEPMVDREELTHVYDGYPPNHRTSDENEPMSSSTH